MSEPMNARALVAETLRIDIAEISADAGFADIEDWDSLAHAEIIIALEDAIGRELDAAEIASIDSLADIDVILLGAG
ncbi:MAG: acyl carrier protein [Proteobacteria bacterium]|nr:acyl carrier protein [Pseudomonadota bacterium]MCK4868693.1 acyl carrier protein [Alphaproteobacteria bacterium]